MPGLPNEMRVIFTEEFRRQIKNLGLIIFTAIILVGMVAAIPITSFVVNLIQNDATDASAETDADPAAPQRIGYVDPQNHLPETETPITPQRYQDADSGIDAVRNGDIDTLFVLSEDYLQSGKVEEYRTARNQSGRFSGNWAAQSAFRDFLRVKLIAGQIDNRTLERVIEPGRYQTYDVPQQGTIAPTVPVAQEIGELLVPTLFGLLLMIAALTGAGSILRSVSEEKETRMIEMLVTSASPISIMTGKLLAAAAAGLIHTAIWITAGAFTLPAVFDRIPGGGELTISTELLVIVSLSFVLGYLLFSTLSLLIGTIVSSAAEGQRQTGLLSMLAGLPIWLTGLIINQPDGTIAQILTLFPFTAPTMIMIRLGGGSEMTAAEIAYPMILLASTNLLMLWIAARLFRANILLSGQRVTPGNVWDAIRHAD